MVSFGEGFLPKNIPKESNNFAIFALTCCKFSLHTEFLQVLLSTALPQKFWSSGNKKKKNGKMNITDFTGVTAIGTTILCNYRNRTIISINNNDT